MKSVMKHQFSQVPRANIPRSTFNRSHGHKTSFDAGYLIPFLCDEALPGDTFNVKSTVFARLATPIVPVMDNMFLDIFYFAVPLRLLWTNFQKFMGEQEDPGDSTDFIVPQAELTGPQEILAGTLSDYLGLPLQKEGISVAAWWHRAYNLIWNEWFRDQNIQDSVTVPKDDGPDSMLTTYLLLRRGKRHDYFTSALPWPQKGPGVNLPLGDTAPIIGSSQTLLSSRVNNATAWDVYRSGTNTKHTTGTLGPNATGVLDDGASQLLSLDPKNQISTSIDPTSTDWEADLSNATAATINSLRQAFQLQRLYERDARGGTRYTEIVRSHFGVTSPDARLQRPEYLGGSTLGVDITQVPQTSSTDATTPQGNLAAFGIVRGTDQGFVKSFTEHCVILGLLSVRADLTYQQGIERMWNRSTRFDFYYPALAHLGEQGILNKEIYYQNTTADDDVFGYQERWAEYRYKPSRISGILRSTASGGIDNWHLSQEFTSLPTLSPTFIEDNPPIDRVIAVPSEPHFIADTYIQMKCARPMPVYSVPGKIDHL